MRQLWRIIWRIRTRLIDCNVGLLAAGVAFYGVLALFPAIAAVLAVGGLVLDAPQIIAQLNEFERVVPGDVLSIVRTQAVAVADASDAGLGLTLAISVGLALWSASRGVAGLVQGLNVVYQCAEMRGFFRLNLRIVCLTALLILGFLVALVAIVLLPALSVYIQGAWQAPGLNVARWALLILMSLTAIAVIYRFGPAQPSAWNWFSVGSVLACVVWLGASSALTYYASQFSTFNESFGALGGVVVLILWLWVLAFAILFGACVNSVLDQS